MPQQHAKRRLIILVCLLAITATGGYAYQHYQFRIRALVWHALHGNSVAVAGYQVTIPRNWWVERGSMDDVTIWNAKTGENIWLRPSPKPRNFTLEGWSELVEKRMNRPEGPIVGRRDLNLAGEPFVCFERDFRINLPPTVALSRSVTTIHGPSIDCNSAGRLAIMFVGGAHVSEQHDFGESYSIMASLRKSE